VRRDEAIQDLREAIKLLNPNKADIKDIDSVIQNFIIKASLSSINDMPMNRECSSSKAAKELRKLASLSVKLRNHINLMHKTSLEAYSDKNVRHPLALEGDLRNLALHGLNSADEIKKENTIKSGAHKKRQAQSIMKYVAETFKMFTGKAGTLIVKPHHNNSAEGVFLDYTKAVFLALDIKASAESQIRAYKKSLKK